MQLIIYAVLIADNREKIHWRSILASWDAQGILETTNQQNLLFRITW